MFEVERDAVECVVQTEYDQHGRMVQNVPDVEIGIERVEDGPEKECDYDFEGQCCLEEEDAPFPEKPWRKHVSVVSEDRFPGPQKHVLSHSESKQEGISDCSQVDAPMSEEHKGMGALCD